MNEVVLHELDALLCYVSQIRRLSLQLTEGISHIRRERHPLVCNRLKHVDLRVRYMKLDVIVHFLYEIRMLINRNS